MSIAVDVGASDADEPQVRVTQARKEKRKALKKLKRKEVRKNLALKEREEEESLANDPEEQLRIRLQVQAEEEAAERERKAFEERERLWLQALAARHSEQEEDDRRKRLTETSLEEEVKTTDDFDEDDEWEYAEEGPAEIIWKGNEIIVKKKRVRVPKRLDEVSPRLISSVNQSQEDERPTSNPFPPKSAVSAQEILDEVAQQVPNFGTEQDKAHCPFHLKTGACRFGLRCSRVHFYPDKSCTLLIKNMYSGPGLAWDQDEGLEFSEEELERCYEEFYEDVHTEFLKFGELVNFKVCRNSSSHLRGNVYIHYKNLESSILAYNTMNSRYYAGKQITCEFVTILRWKVAICGEFMKSRLKTCSRGSACNFIHCFHNPGGDYEWADWDKPPPMHWRRKMAVLFGTGDELRHNSDLDLNPHRCNHKSSHCDDRICKSRHPHDSSVNISKRHRDRVSSRGEKATKKSSCLDGGDDDDNDEQIRSHRRREKTSSGKGYKHRDHPKGGALTHVDDDNQYHRDRH